MAQKEMKGFPRSPFYSSSSRIFMVKTLENDEQVADDSYCHLCSILEFMKYFHMWCPVWSSERTCEVVITISISGQRVLTVEIIL